MTDRKLLQAFLASVLLLKFRCYFLCSCNFLFYSSYIILLQSLYVVKDQLALCESMTSLKSLFLTNKSFQKVEKGSSQVAATQYPSHNGNNNDYSHSVTFGLFYCKRFISCEPHECTRNFQISVIKERFRNKNRTDYHPPSY